MNNVSVNIWQKINGLDTELILFSHPTYPCYVIGNVIFLEKEVLPSIHNCITKNNPEIRLTKFVISDIHHSVKQMFVPDNEIHSLNVGFKIHTFLSMDVHVLECED